MSASTVARRVRAAAVFFAGFFCGIAALCAFGLYGLAQMPETRSRELPANTHQAPAMGSQEHAA